MPHQLPAFTVSFKRAQIFPSTCWHHTVNYSMFHFLQAGLKGTSNSKARNLTVNIDTSLNSSFSAISLFALSCFETLQIHSISSTRIYSKGSCVLRESHKLWKKMKGIKANLKIPVPSRCATRTNIWSTVVKKRCIHILNVVCSVLFSRWTWIMAIACYSYRACSYKSNKFSPWHDIYHIYQLPHVSTP